MGSSSEELSWGCRVNQQLLHRLCGGTKAAAISGIRSGSRTGKRWGFGMEFAELRHYAQGDDRRHIDWKASSRSQQLMTRVYIEDNDARVAILVDLMQHMYYGSSKRLCSVLAVYLAALLAGRFRAHFCHPAIGWINDKQAWCPRPATQPQQLARQLERLGQMHNARLDVIRASNPVYASEQLKEHIHFRQLRGFSRLVLISCLPVAAHYPSQPKPGPKLEIVSLFDRQLDSTPEQFNQLNNGSMVHAGSNILPAMQTTDWALDNNASLSKADKLTLKLVAASLQNTRRWKNYAI